MSRPLPQTDRLPHALYLAEQVRALDRCAIEEYGIPGAELMERAGAAAFRLLREHWPGAADITLLCGVGNNGGDGYVVARLARAAGLTARVLQLGDPERLSGDARTMAERYRQAGGEVLPARVPALPRRTGVIVDAVLGTGLEREVTGDWAALLEAISQHAAPVLALDIPSGLHADTGRILGCAVRARVTVSFIALKRGLFTGQGPDCCGRVHFAGLEVPATLYARQILAARRLDWAQQATTLRPRRRTAHKGDFGHLLVVGGAPGFSGAVRLAGEAALRCGAGLVSLATHPAHAAALTAGRPELMCHGVTGPGDLAPLLGRASVVALGPGLGQAAWGRDLWQAVLASGRPLVMDADGLNLLAETPLRRDDWVLTPHPGEAGRLLGVSAAEVQQDRFAALERLRTAYGGCVVLKGAGTLVAGDSRRPPAVCDQGNPGMAGGGMGDVLTGVIAALWAQGADPEEAAGRGVCLHGAAADRAAAEGGERGLLAADLFPWLRRLHNPEPAPC
jgi:hydroxyethylthiazole kinase-like uncharacterized protein yjeF